MARIRNFALIIVVLLAMALLSYAWLGTYSRMIADDYCHAYEAVEYGVVGGVIHKYQTWSSRYSTFFLHYSLAPLQPAIHILLPAIFLLGWLIAFYIFFNAILNIINFEDVKLGAALLALIVTYVMTSSNPSPQNIYWFGAIIPYTLPLILIIAYIGRLIRHFKNTHSVSQDILLGIVHMIVVLILCGFAEGMTTSIITLHGLAFLLIPIIPKAWRRTYIIVVIVGLVAGLTNLIFSVTAPGIAVRQEVINTRFQYEQPSLFMLALNSFISTIVFLFAETYGLAHMFFMSFAIFISFVAYYNWKDDAHEPYLPDNAIKVIAFAFGAGILLIMSVVVPPLYASGVIVARTLSIARLIQILIFGTIAYLSASIFIRRKWLNIFRRSKLFRPVLGALILMMAFLPILTIYTNLTRLPEFSAYAQSWDERHNILRAADDGAEVIVPELAYNIEDYLFLEKIEIEPNWVSRCVARYYGLNSIRIDPESVVSDSE